jgi:uncharacterized protein (TIGR02147 family)
MGVPHLKAMRPDIFRYHDMRAYLATLFVYLREVDPQFSLRHLAEKSGVSLGLLSGVIANKITLTEKALHKISPHLGLPQNEVIFFGWLRALSESSKNEERVRAFNNIRRHGRFSEAQKKELDAYRYLTKWYYPVVRELALWPEFQLDAKWVRDRLNGKISLVEAKDALLFLLSRGYLVTDDNGVVRLGTPKITCTGGIFRLAMSEYHKQLLDIAKNSIAEIERDHRDINALTISCDEDGILAVKEIFREALEKLRLIGEGRSRKSKVLQMHLLAFPVAQNADQNAEPKKKVSE